MTEQTDNDHKIPPPRLDQCAHVLAVAVRCTLAEMCGDDWHKRYAIMAVFLHQVTAKLEHPMEMAGIMRALATELDGGQE